MALLDPIFADADLVPEGFRTSTLDGLAEVVGGWFNEQGEDEDFWPPGKPASFILRWKNSATSREHLGSPMGAIAKRRLDLLRFWWSLEWRDSSHKKESKQRLREEIRRMKRGEKVEPTVFEVVVEIFRDHAPGGVEMENEVSGVILLLE